MKKEQYRWFLQANDNPKIPFSPIYGDGMAVEWARETNQRFYRCKLSDKITILGPLYSQIVNGNIETKYTVYVEQFVGGSWLPLCQGQFYKTNCTIDYEEQVITVQPDYSDAYNDVLDCLDKEFDVLSKPMPNSEVWITKRPMLQLYAMGDNVVSCYCGGSYYEQDVQDAVRNKTDLVNKYFFAPIAQLVELNFEGQNEILAGLDGTYVGQTQLKNDEELEYFGELERYPPNSVLLVEIQHTALPNNPAELKKPTITIRRRGTAEVLYKAVSNIPQDATSVELTFVNEKSPSQAAIKGTIIMRNMFARYMVDVEELNGLKTNVLPPDDIVLNNANYRYAIGYKINIAVISARTSDEPTEWGLNFANKYYAPPYGLDYRYYPLGRSTWRWASCWYYFPLEAENLEVKARKQYAMRDAYDISVIINSFLKEFAPNVTHENSMECSMFLYGGFGGVSLFLTQKSNLLSGEYTQAARKAKTTLGQIFDMLKNCFQCYWFIEDGKLKIEHIRYFKNGGSYLGDIKTIGSDLTTAECVKNGKKWAFKQSEISYDTEAMPQRYEFSWMDEVSKGFEGYPLEIISRYVEDGKVEDITIGCFTTDVDFMLMNANEISKDGFALLDTQIRDGKRVVPFVKMHVDGQRYDMQNGNLSFMSIQKSYWLDDLPAWSIKVNNEIAAALGISRNKVSNVTIPLSGVVFDPKQLIKTNVGEGEIEKISINLQTKFGKATLRYETK